MKYSSLKTLAAGLVAAMALAGTAQAGPQSNCSYISQSLVCEAPLGGAEAADDTAVYAGVQFTVGSGAVKPRLVVGARSLHVDTDNSVTGADLAMRFGLDGGITMDSAVLSLVGGRNDAMANVGLGYSYASDSWMTTAALQTSHLRAGADYVFTLAKPEWFIEIDSLQKPTTKGGALTCPDGLNLQELGDLYEADPDVTVDGKSCFYSG